MTTTTDESAISAKPVWFITGCSTGFGRELAKHVLELGYRAVVTARKPDEVADLEAKGEALILKLDVTDQGQIDAAIKVAKEEFGRIDVLVNNAGIGYFAAVEEGEDEQGAFHGVMRVRSEGCICGLTGCVDRSGRRLQFARPVAAITHNRYSLFGDTFCERGGGRTQARKRTQAF